MILSRRSIFSSLLLMAAAGCASDGNQHVVASGHPDLSFTTSQAGRVSIMDTTTNQTIHSSDVPATADGMAFMIHGDNLYVYRLGAKGAADQTLLTDQDVDPAHNFKIIFAPSTRPAESEIK